MALNNWGGGYQYKSYNAHHLTKLQPLFEHASSFLGLKIKVQGHNKGTTNGISLPILQPFKLTSDNHFTWSDFSTKIREPLG